MGPHPNSAGLSHQYGRQYLNARLARISHTVHDLRRDPDGQSARRSPKSVSGHTVKGFDTADARLGATLRAVSSNGQGASARLSDVPASHRAAFLPCPFEGAAQTVYSVRNAG